MKVMAFVAGKYFTMSQVQKERMRSAYFPVEPGKTQGRICVLETNFFFLA